VIAICLQALEEIQENAQRLVAAGHDDHRGVVALVAEFCWPPGAAVSPLCFYRGSH